MTRRLRFVALLMLAGLVAHAGPATGSGAGGYVSANGWGAATPLFSPSPADAPQSVVRAPTLALDGRGRATAVWLYAPLGRGTTAGVVMESDWTASRGWTPARTLTAFGTDVFSPLSLAVDARGDAVIAWAAPNRVRVSYRPAGRGWQSPRTLSTDGDSVGAPPGPLVALDDRGRALVAWSAARGSPSSHPSLEIAARSATGAWGKPKVLCACLAARALRMTASGLALVVWSPYPPGAGLWAETRSPSGRWSTRQEISPLGGTSLNFYESVGLNARGGAVVAWAAGTDSTLTTAIRPAHGRSWRVRTIGGWPYNGYAVAIAPTGEAVLMWEYAGCCLYAASRRPGASSFTAPQTLAPGLGKEIPQALAMDVRGNTLALWARSQDSSSQPYGDLYLHAAQRPASGKFGAGSDIGAIGEDSYHHIACNGEPSLATTPDGRLALAVWLTRIGDNGQCGTVQAATFKR